jgi:type I restriction enzyme S subunit
VLDWFALTPEFQAIIEQGYEVIYSPQKNGDNAWPRVRLGDVAEIIMGQSPKSEYYNTTGDGMPFLQGNRTFGMKYPTFDTFTTSLTKKAEPNDIIMSVRAPVGEVNITPITMCLGRGVCALRMKNKEQEFLYYLIKANIHKLLNKQSGTIFGSVNHKDIYNLDIHLPPLSIQRAIAATLSCMDDKIEMNNRINANLEAQAQAIFKSWFDSQGDKSWKYGKLSDIAMVNPQRNLKKGVHAPYLEMANLPTHGSFPSNWETKIFSGGMKFKNGDTILARITPCLENGKTAYINFMKEGEIGYGSTEYIVLSAKDGYPNEVLYFLARTEDFRNYAIKNMTGTSGRQRVSADIIERYKIKIPPKEAIDKYRTLFNSYMSIIRRNSLESRTLAAIRDALLPRLMSGEIEVKE